MYSDCYKIISCGLVVFMYIHYIYVLSMFLEYDRL